MWTRKNWMILAVLASVAILAVAGAMTRHTWQEWLNPSDSSAGQNQTQAEETADHVHLSPQARANLGLVVKPVQLTKTFWRTIQIPGSVVEYHGKSDRGVTAPIAGVVKKLTAFPGDTVRPGEKLFTLRLIGDSLQNSQTELYKTVNELAIKKEEMKRLRAGEGAIAQERLIDMEHQQLRLQVALKTLRFELGARGLSGELIQGIEKGKFVTEIIIRVPGRKAEVPFTPSPSIPDTVYEVEKLHVQLGEQVHAGQILCTLADHQKLFVEGRVFKQEVPLLERAAQEGWPVQVDLPEEEPTTWPTLPGPLKILFVGNRFDAVSQTVPVYVPLPNQYREYKEEGKTYRVWRFRPDHAVYLNVPVDRFQDVFVLPAAAVVREGPEAYVFRQDSDLFERKPVHVLYQDRRHAVIANDGSITAGNPIVHNMAAHLDRLLKIRLGSEGGQDHDH